jgi:GGDEF domain-containing protein/ABC-type amino acid transport substrate-binding protein
MCKTPALPAFCRFMVLIFLFMRNFWYRCSDQFESPGPSLLPMTIKIIIACISVVTVFCLPAFSETVSEPLQIRVGIDQNPPLSYFDKKQRPAGVMVDLLDHVARQEGWKLEYSACVWDSCLEQLQQGNIDLMVTIAYSAERAKKFDFSEVTAFNLWGQLYVRESSNISSYLDLDGKTIAVVRNNTHEKAIRTLLSQFGVKARFVEVPDYSAVFEAIQSEQADAGAVGRFFGISMEDEYSVKSTQLLFNPIEVRFAATKGVHKHLLADLDRHMTAMKADRHSVYYKALDGWLGITQKRALPNWLRLLFVVGGSILLVVAGLALALRLQVNSRTLHLQQEIAERKRYEAELEYQATYDSLTGLPNRMLLTDRINQTMIQARRHGAVVPLILIDLDNFKIVNDTLGHDAGDDLLKQVSKRLLGAVRDSDTVARLGGDEFVVLPTDLVNAEDSITVAEKIMEAFAVPMSTR